MTIRSKYVEGKEGSAVSATSQQTSQTGVTRKYEQNKRRMLRDQTRDTLVNMPFCRITVHPVVVGCFFKAVY
jgi:hypothetical protein